ncbi:transport and Golgi organization 2 homolog isoform X2 [Ricinus communis]|uniref:transport and Golgi organization 2 homolog isoform X2 n=1 Tax=Ricinus communis TaxID=3988 RepID=UPI00201A7917|nr:transport and Golgi organization 2 homolog isoform X2 [Ricinus communis]XP_048234518.1 transport and Golgi organization 2 homolog isoform X2 [Ricinus communis]XP_048234519.1 transport and Golgi organization 2 homolog isoform X2 [Ricinus communis]XP_048234520.1 transport and Golgi organization 2 homolog isoform X2 [Ricinus communis]
MCIAVFLWQAHPLYPFLLLLNRDEYHSRPTKPLSWWGSGDQILGGRDEQAGGTWLACTKDGKIAFLTNVREIISTPTDSSRGDLPVNFLQSNKNPKDFAEDLAKKADKYNGFNLILADICSKSMVYITNRPKAANTSIIDVPPGMHVLSNASLDSPWPKAQRLRQNLKDVIDNYGETELPVIEMVEILMTNTVKDEESMLPKIYPSEFEYQLSSIFVDTDTPLGRYGTRSTSMLSVKSSGEINFYERYLEKETWHEHKDSFWIEKMEKTDEINSASSF